MGHPVWPLFDLEIRTPRITLRYVDDDLATRLAVLALEGVHDPAEMPFEVPWTDAESPFQERGSLQFYWRERSTLSHERWSLPFATIVDGEVVGMQGMSANRFGILREVATGSWLVQRAQGQGIGTEMRHAVLHLAFAGLHAERAVTGAHDDNGPSNGVTRRLGYEPNGHTVSAPRGTPVRQNHYLMTRAHWEAHLQRDDIVVTGLEPCLDMLAATT